MNADYENTHSFVSIDIDTFPQGFVSNDKLCTKCGIFLGPSSSSTHEYFVYHKDRQSLEWVKAISCEEYVMRQALE